MFGWEAASYCEALALGGHLDWRLPTISELRSLVIGCTSEMAGGECTVTDDCLEQECWNEACEGCPYAQGPGSDGDYCDDALAGLVNYYWSSSGYASDISWLIHFRAGHHILDLATADEFAVRCVREEL